MLRRVALTLLAAACTRSAPGPVREPVAAPVASSVAAPAGSSAAGTPAAGVPATRASDATTRPIHARPALPSEDPPWSAASAAGASSIRVLLFGDFGAPTEQQRAVAAMMIDAHLRQPFDLAFSLGDNVYDCGLDVTLPGAKECRFDASGNATVAGYHPPHDPRFHERFERPLLPLASASPPLAVHAVLGNHDVAGGIHCREGGLGRDQLARTRACLQVAQRSPVWRMPGRHYVVESGPARFVVIDSNLLVRDYGGFSLDAEVAFVREAVSGAAGRRVFLVAHHPAATAGKHRKGFDERYLERVRRILDAGGGAIEAWIAGHDHVLQQVRNPAGLDVFVSGNGSIDRPSERFDDVAPAGSERVFGSNAWGFAVLDVSRSGWSVTFETGGGRSLHCCRAAGAGPCESIACPVPQAPGGARGGP